MCAAAIEWYDFAQKLSLASAGAHISTQQNYHRYELCTMTHGVLHENIYITGSDHLIKYDFTHYKV